MVNDVAPFESQSGDLLFSNWNIWAGSENRCIQTLFVRKTPGSVVGFPVLKGPSRSNGSSEALWRLSEAWAAVLDQDWFGELKPNYKLYFQNVI